MGRVQAYGIDLGQELELHAMSGVPSPTRVSVRFEGYPELLDLGPIAAGTLFDVHSAR
jgi:hypothetical protein